MIWQIIGFMMILVPIILVAYYSYISSNIANMILDLIGFVLPILYIIVACILLFGVM